jgi:anion-transporting  ArsA/GET3 family ATPase
MIAPLLSTRLIFVTGKGGVGKSTVCAGLGHALAKLGKRTLIVETDTYSAMADLLQLPIPDAKTTRVTDKLDVANLSSEEALVEIIQQFVQSERLARGVISNQIAQVFFKAAPAVNEFVLLNRIHKYYQQSEGARPAYDHIVVDLPASGHAITFLNVPNTLHGMMRVGAFAQLTRQVGDLIEDPKRCSIVAICLPEEMPVNETVELADGIKANLKRPLSLAILNMVHPAPFEQQRLGLFKAIQDNRIRQEASLSDHTIRLLAGTSLAQDWFERDLHYTGILRERLDNPIVELPMFYEQRGALVVERIASTLCGHAPPPKTLAS